MELKIIQVQKLSSKLGSKKTSFHFNETMYNTYTYLLLQITMRHEIVTLENIANLIFLRG